MIKPHGFGESGFFYAIMFSLERRSCVIQLCKVAERIIFSLCFISLFLLNGCAAHRANTHMSKTTKQICQNNTLLQHYHCSLTKLETAAQHNDPDAEYALGYVYYYGVNDSADAYNSMATAKLWMRRAAAQGQPQAIQALQLLQDSETGSSTEEKVKTTQTKATVVPRAATPLSKKTTVVAKTQTTTQLTTPTEEPYSYSIQLAASVDLPRLQEYVLAHHLKGKAGYYKACIDGKRWYILIYGHYANRILALQTLHNLPGSLKAGHPWLKSYSTIMQQIEQGKVCESSNL